MKQLLVLGWIFVASSVGALEVDLCEEFVASNSGSISGNGKVIVQGSGASFPNLLYQDVMFSYGFKESESLVSYSATGSGSGKCRIQSFCEECDHPFVSAGIDDSLPAAIDFAGSDSLLKASEYQIYGDLQMLPACAGAVVPIFNVHGMTELVLNTTVVSRIFRQCDNETDVSCQGDAIYFWNDRAIVELNPGSEAELNDAGRIQLVVREDKSGTTEIWKKSLASFDPKFEAQVGTSSSPSWNNVKVQFAAGNAGVASMVLNQPSSIGYSVLAEAKGLGIPMAKLKKSPTSPPVEATSSSVTFALSEKGLDFGNNGDDPSRMTADVHNAVGTWAWPIVGYTYFVLRMNTTRVGAKCENRLATLNYLSWCYTNPVVAELAEKHGFGVLPLEAQKVVLSKLRTEFYCSGRLVYEKPKNLEINLHVNPLMIPSLSLVRSVWHTLSKDSTLNIFPLVSDKPTQDYRTPHLTLAFQEEAQGEENGYEGKVSLVEVDYAIVFNLCGASSTCAYANTRIELTPDTLGKILDGTISHWNDADIVAKSSIGNVVSLPAETISVVRVADANDLIWENRFQAKLKELVPGFVFSKVSSTVQSFELAKAKVYATPFTLTVAPLTSSLDNLADTAFIKIADKLVGIDDFEDYPFQDHLEISFPQAFPDRYCEKDAEFGIAPGKEFAQFLDWFLGEDTLATPLSSNGMKFIPQNTNALKALLKAQKSVTCFGVSVMLPEHDIMTPAPTFKVFVLCMVGLTNFVACGLIVWIMLRRKTGIIRASSWSFLIQILVGCMISVSTIIPLIQDDSELFEKDANPTEAEIHTVYDRLDIACKVQPFLFLLGYGFVFTPLLLKNWRIVKLFNNKKLKKLTISNKELLKYELIIIGTLLCILIAWTAMDGLRYRRTILALDPITGTPTKSMGRCECERPLTWITPLLVFVISTLVFGNYLSYKGRKVPVAFSEGKWVAIALINFLECFVLCVPMLATTVDTPDLDAIVKSMFVFVVYVGTMAIIFAPKLYIATHGYTTESSSSIGATSAAKNGHVVPAPLGTSGVSGGTNTHQSYI